MGTRRDFMTHTVAASLASAVPSLRGASCSEVGRFTYTNPIPGVMLRDCQIVREGPVYTMTGTFPPFWPPQRNPGVRITQSSDLVHWTEPKLVVTPNLARWYQQLFWAAEIFPHRERYYLTFNCASTGAAPVSEDPPTPLAVGLAVSHSITGPYQVLTEERPLIDGNDGTLFCDRDGRVYVYSARAASNPSEIAGIYGSEVDLDAGALIGQTQLCISKGENTDWDGGEQVGIEGPSVFRRNGIYYLLYSSWRRGYEVGYATAPTALGPWKKQAGHPIYGAQDPEVCRQLRTTYTQAPEVPFGQVGHGSPFYGPDGRLWFGCHGIEQQGRGPDVEPHLVITPMEFMRDGSLSMKLTWTPQTVSLPSARPDPLWRDRGTPAAFYT
jgi:beta-xylosidase